MYSDMTVGSFQLLPVPQLVGSKHCFPADAPLLESGVQASANVQPAKQYDLLLIYLTQPGSSIHNTPEPHGGAESNRQPDIHESTSGKANSERGQHQQQTLFRWLDDLVGHLSADPSAQTHLLLMLILSNLCESNIAAPKVCGTAPVSGMLCYWFKSSCDSRKPGVNVAARCH